MSLKPVKNLSYTQNICWTHTISLTLTLNPDLALRPSASSLLSVAAPADEPPVVASPLFLHHTLYLKTMNKEKKYLSTCLELKQNHHRIKTVVL